MKPTKKSKKSDKESRVSKKDAIKKAKDVVKAKESKVAKDAGSKAKTSSSDDKKIKESKASPVPTVQPPPAPAVIKLPYPVINDRRDMSTILGTLETKRKELFKKLEENKESLQAAKSSEKRQKLKLLKQTLDGQREKIEMQLEYVRLALSLENLRNVVSSNPAVMHTEGPKLTSLGQKMTEMYNYMKNANKQYLKKQQGQAEQPAQAASGQEKTAAGSGATVAQPPRAPSPTEKLTSQYEVVCNSLASLIAHTAATAHSAAAIAYMNYYQYTAYQKQQEQLEQQQKQGKKKTPDAGSDHAPPLPPMRPLVPLKSELEKASNVFAKYKNKISSFFEVSSKKKAPEPTKKAKDEMTGLKLLLQAYAKDDNQANSSGASSSDSDSDDEPVVTKKAEPKSEPQEPAKVAPPKPKTDDEDEDDLDDLEIVTTSELKSQANKRNYLLPSLKASYFPLKASLENANLAEGTMFGPCSSSLIAVEKSKHALTFLGRPSSIYIGRQQEQAKLADILYKSAQV